MAVETRWHVNSFSRQTENLERFSKSETCLAVKGKDSMARHKKTAFHSIAFFYCTLRMRRGFYRKNGTSNMLSHLEAAGSAMLSCILLTGSTYQNYEFILHSKLSAFQFYAVFYAAVVLYKYLLFSCRFAKINDLQE